MTSRHKTTKRALKCGYIFLIGLLKKLTVRKFRLDLIVIDLERRIGGRPREPDNVVAAIVHLRVHFPDGVVLAARIVRHENVTINLKKYQIY